MKNQIIIFTLCFAFILGCGDDEEPTLTHEMGDWELVNFALLNLPPGFTSREAQKLELNEISYIQAYQLSLKSDGTYSRTIEESGFLPNSSSGEWRIAETTFTLTPDDDANAEENYKVEENENDNFWISDPEEFQLIPDIYYDTVTQDFIDYYNALDIEAKNAINATLFQKVSLDLAYIFERQ